MHHSYALRNYSIFSIIPPLPPKRGNNRRTLFVGGLEFFFFILMITNMIHLFLRICPSLIFFLSYHSLSHTFYKSPLSNSSLFLSVFLFSLLFHFTLLCQPLLFYLFLPYPLSKFLNSLFFLLFLSFSFTLLSPFISLLSLNI